MKRTTRLLILSVNLLLPIAHAAIPSAALETATMSVPFGNYEISAPTEVTVNFDMPSKTHISCTFIHSSKGTTIQYQNKIHNIAYTSADTIFFVNANEGSRINFPHNNPIFVIPAEKKGSFVIHVTKLKSGIFYGTYPTSISCDYLSSAQ